MIVETELRAFFEYIDKNLWISIAHKHETTVSPIG